MNRTTRASLTLAVMAVAALVSLGGIATASAASPPSIESESVSKITPTDATVEAQINPGGLETTYEVWVGRLPGCIEENLGAVCESTGEGTEIGTGEIVGTIPASFSAQSVTIDIAKAWHGLSPNTSYIYSVRAVNSDGKAYGNGNREFKTLPASAPSIESESVSKITPTDATLEAQINTEGLETSYQFRLESGCLAPRECAAITVYPLPSGKLLGSFVGQSVSLDLNSAGVTLEPGVEYAYSVTATSAADSVAGREQRFTTPSEPPPPNAQTSGTGGQPSLQSSPSASPLHHRRHHRKHKRGLRRGKLYRATHTG